MQADDGYLYPLEKAFFYVHKPPMLIGHDEIDGIEFARQGGGVLAASAKTFDLNVRTHGSTVRAAQGSGVLAASAKVVRLMWACTAAQYSTQPAAACTCHSGIRDAANPQQLLAASAKGCRRCRASQRVACTACLPSQGTGRCWPHGPEGDALDLPDLLQLGAMIAGRACTGDRLEHVVWGPAKWGARPCSSCIHPLSAHRGRGSPALACHGHGWPGLC